MAWAKRAVALEKVEAPPRGRILTSLRNRDFRLVWFANLTWSTSRWMEMVVLGWLVLELTNSPFLLGLVMAGRGLAMVLFAAIGGVAADRFNRRLLLIAAQSGAVALALTMTLLTGTGLVQVWQVFIVTFLGGTMMSFSAPTRQAFIYDLVGAENLTNALAINSAAVNTTRIFGPSLGGVLIGLVGVSGSYSLMTLTYLAGVACLIAVQRRERISKASEDSVWNNLREGFSYIFRYRVVLALLGIEVMMDIFAMPYLTLMPVFARDVLGVGAEGLGFLLGASGTGSLLGALGVASVGNVRRKALALLLTGAITGLVLILFAYSPYYPLSLALLLGVGLVSAVYNNMMATLLQLTVPDQMRGRVMGVYVLTWGMMPIGSVQAGAVANLMGAPFALGLGGAITALFILGLAWQMPSLRRLP